MSTVVSVWIVLTVLLGIAAWIAVWSRRQTMGRILSVLVFLSGSPVAGVSIALCLGWPIPLIAGITGPAGDYTVLGHKLIANEAIYLMIDVGNVPRHYVLPWDQNAAKKLQDAADKGEGMVATIPPFEMTWERRDPLSLHELPQPRVLPEKPRQAEAPTHFDSI